MHQYADPDCTPGIDRVRRLRMPALPAVEGYQQLHYRAPVVLQDEEVESPLRKCVVVSEIETSETSLVMREMGRGIQPTLYMQSLLSCFRPCLL